MVRRLLLLAVLIAGAAHAAPADRSAVLGKDGVLRWQNTQQEVRCSA